MPAVERGASLTSSRESIADLLTLLARRTSAVVFASLFVKESRPALHVLSREVAQRRAGFVSIQADRIFKSDRRLALDAVSKLRKPVRQFAGVTTENPAL